MHRSSDGCNDEFSALKLRGAPWARHMASPPIISASFASSKLTFGSSRVNSLRARLRRGASLRLPRSFCCLAGPRGHRPSARAARRPPASNVGTGWLAGFDEGGGVVGPSVGTLRHVRWGSEADVRQLLPSLRRRRWSSRPNFRCRRGGISVDFSRPSAQEGHSAAQECADSPRDPRL